MTCNWVLTLQENVTAVLTASTTDVLSHVAIRARSQKVRCLFTQTQLQGRCLASITATCITFLIQPANCKHRKICASTLTRALSS